VGPEAKKGETVEITLGVSGYLMNSAVLLWDRQSQTLWSQVSGKGIAGPRSGESLEALPVADTTWAAWKKRHPATKVLRPPGPAERYAQAGYAGYHQTDKIIPRFAPELRSDRLRNKAVVTGVALGEAAVCFDHGSLKKAAEARGEKAAATPLVFERKVGEATVKVTYDLEGDAVTVTDADGKSLPIMRLYWFAWYAFHPDTEVDEGPAK
jgi:hypothetical protein